MSFDLWPDDFNLLPDVVDRDADTGTPNGDPVGTREIDRDSLMRNQFGPNTRPESGDGPDIDDPEPTMEAAELGVESRRAMQEMDTALREIDDIG